MKKSRNTFILLGVIYLSYIAVGFPDGAFGVAWPSLRVDMEQPLEQAGVIFIVHAITTAFTSSLFGKISHLLKIEIINIIGSAMMAVGLFGVSLAPNFFVLLVFIGVIGAGMGLADSSINSFVVQSFEAKHMNWLHCFWGLGATISPIIMAQMIVHDSWRSGYAVMSVVQAVIVVVLIISVVKGVWSGQKKRKITVEEEAGTESKGVAKRFLSSKHHQFLEVFIFFLYGGIEYSIGFWITSVLIESRGLAIESASIFPAVYYACLMIGRMVFGLISNKFSDMAIVRFGSFVGSVGLVILIFSNSLIGMAIVGLGVAPIFPCLMHDTANRFQPSAVGRLIGLELAAYGIGVAVLSSLKGAVLANISLEALFPLVIGIVIATTAVNELLANRLKRMQKGKMV